jgi:hypothetical protein
VNEFVVEPVGRRSAGGSPSDDGPPRAAPTPVAAATTRVLKELTAVYVLDEPALGVVHDLQAEVVTELFGVFLEGGASPRAAGDAIAELDDREALQRHAARCGPDLATHITTLTTLPPAAAGERAPALATALAAGRAAAR